MRTLIAVPCMDSVPAQFAQSLAMLQKVDECAITFNVGSLVYKSRNKLAKAAVQMGADYVFWLDSDMVFEPDTLIKMHKVLKETGADILTGLYFRRATPFSPVLFGKLEISKTGCEWEDVKEIPDKPFEVAGCGFGCVLMPTEIFLDVSARYKQMFDPIGGVGEDLSFCWRARELGYKIICDPSISLGHVGHTVVNRQFYEAVNNARRS